MNNFKKAYLEIILEETNIISEGKFLNNLLAGVGGLAITGGSILGLNEVSKIEHPQNNTPKIVQQIEQDDQIETPAADAASIDDEDDEKPDDKKINDLTEKEYFVARVLYSETSTIASVDELKMLCQVIVNRIGEKDFGDGKITKDAYEVIKVKNAFSCINDPNNTNWNEFKPDLNNRTELCVNLAKILLRDDVKQITFYPDTSIVYYHDTSISKAEQQEIVKDWTNKYWKPILKKTTKHFKFYSVTSNVKGK